jgi:hypothetical protein
MFAAISCSNVAPFAQVMPANGESQAEIIKAIFSDIPEFDGYVEDAGNSIIVHFKSPKKPLDRGATMVSMSNLKKHLKAHTGKPSKTLVYSFPKETLVL